MPIILSGMKTPVHSPGMKVPLHSGHLHRPLLSGFICAPQFGHFGQRLLGITSPPLQLCFSFRFVLWLSCLLYLKRRRRWEDPFGLSGRLQQEGLENALHGTPVSFFNSEENGRSARWQHSGICRAKLARASKGDRSFLGNRRPIYALVVRKKPRKTPRERR
jgi:hypothetical protein